MELAFRWGLYAIKISLFMFCFLSFLFFFLSPVEAPDEGSQIASRTFDDSKCGVEIVNLVRINIVPPVSSGPQCQQLTKNKMDQWNSGTIGSWDIGSNVRMFQVHMHIYLHRHISNPVCT
jgi:hypothetical protein